MEPDRISQLLEKYSFEAKSLPCNLALNSKRNQLLLSHHYSLHRNPEWLASLELEEQLAEYSSRVDDRKGVNNFAAATLDLCSKLRKDCKSWKCSLTPGGSLNLEQLLKENADPCSNYSKGGCTAGLPTEEELVEFREFKLPNSDFEANVRPSRGGDLKSFGNVPSFGSTAPTRTPLAPHFSGHQPTKQPPHQPLTDSRQSGFVTKRSQFTSGPYAVNKDISNSYRSTTVGPQRNLCEPKTDGFTGYPTGGGIYTSRVGGRFKKWGKDKMNDKLENDEPVPDGGSQIQGAGYQSNGGSFAGTSRNQQGNFHRDESAVPPGLASFKTAGDQLKIDVQKKHGGYGSFSGNPHDGSLHGYTAGRSYGNNFNGSGDPRNYVNPGGAPGDNSLLSGGRRGQGGYGGGTYHPIRSIKKSLGGKGVVNNRFVPPMKNCVEKKEPEEPHFTNSPEEEVDERLKNIEPRMVELIKNEIMDCGSKITWDDIAGLHFAKNTIQEIVVWPMLRPDIFTGLRRPPKGILLFGPPGTGKTLIGKCIASQSGSTFFSISASSLTSKWIGEGEKMVRALFAVARVHQPAVVFIDEIDSLLSQRSETEHESSRRIKTEFLVQLDGAGTDEEDRLLVIGATNRPQELDEAARRRLVKRLYIPLPDLEARKEMIIQLMKYERNDLTEQEVLQLAESTDGYSGADMKHLCQEACLGPIRSLGPSLISSIAANQVRPVSMVDFTSALKRVHPSVGQEDLHQYVAWNKTYGSGA